MPVPVCLFEQREQETQQALRNLRALPSITRDEINDEDTCPICLLSLHSILEDSKEMENKQEGTSDLGSENLTATRMAGVVKLSTCSHIFCRKDLAEWIESHHGSCPTCRQTFFAFTPIDEAEYESSDGGEYIPEDDEGHDDYTDVDFDLMTSSDVDIEMGDSSSGIEDDDEDNSEEAGYTPLTRVNDGGEIEPGIRMRRRASLLYRPQQSDEFRVHAYDDGRNETGTELEADLSEHGDSGALSYGSDSSSSEGVSFNSEVDHEANAITVNIISSGSSVSENRDLSVNIGHTETKSPDVHKSGPSDTPLAVSSK